MADLETLDSTTECLECSGPPPVFRLPPPPRPPFLTEGTFCSEAPLAELEDCVAIPMIDASYHTNPSLQNTALIITCAVVLLLMAAIVSVVFWKHKRKVQGLLPCKSAAASASAGVANRRNLAEGQTLQGTNTSGSGGALYEDLTESTHHHHHTQLHNHLSGHSGCPPTIEVRGLNAKQHGENVQPAQHHLDYLDYRDPRSILRVSEKPSRAVLGGYRTPRALLAKSQGVSQTIAATHLPTSNTLGQQSNQSAHVATHNNYVEPNTLTNQTHLTSQSSNNYSDSIYDNLERNGLASETTVATAMPPASYATINEIVRPPSLSPFTNNVHITPIHNITRIEQPTSQLASEMAFSMAEQQTNSESRRRRPSVDSEGYSYIDIDNRHKFDTRLDKRYQGSSSNSSYSSHSSNGRTKYEYYDIDGYSYVDTGVRKPPGWAKRVATGDATDDEICPLCTIQQIHQLLAKPEQPYSHQSRKT